MDIVSHNNNIPKTNTQISRDRLQTYMSHNVALGDLECGM